MTTHDNMIKKWKEDPAFMAEYEALEEEFTLLDELLKARAKANMTQEDVARAMNTKAPAVARIEAGGGSKKHSPSIATLRRYAKAVGCRLKIKLEPVKP
ncbi:MULTISPECIES: helix-turn-helix domain-containing protein [Desulfobacula]|uniref:Predicted transcriptional regulator, XRE family n=2 Tax=Desulfobacula TaxID=28222 RepID=K0NAS7_DESTT|nr:MULTISPECIES: helix-turn-helix transcriptional regulator [Desulfobacula]CCK81264.1 predicted transcriptional regulator, XRE family [Desulfobacula toluolica Tol2]SDU66049.1 Helix-turn-helix [Desulfobacula phenolica]